ncbi:MAG: hypothetical protein JXB88_18470, partial [Spirochaetales bacterium]|nr:hypothetical protein [Spirochaetales bacterium]
MSKKIVVIVIMVVIGCGVCLGRGMYEKEVVIKLECADNVTLNKYFKINIEPIWGKYKITILEKVHAWAVIYDDDCTVSDAFNNNDELNQILNRYKDTNPTGTDYNYEIISEYHLSDAAHYNSTYLKTKNTIGNPQFYIDKCGVKKFCKIILFHDSGTYDCYIFEIIPEFFMGEFELFGESENEENYNKKCADFLQKFIDDTSFHKILKDIFGELIANLIDYEKLKDGGYYDSFTYAMSSHIKKDYEIRELNKNGQMIQLHVPYLDFSEVNPCEALYSEDRNKYITAYMHYLYDIKKPVLSYIIQERLNGRYEESYSINKNFLHYDYTHYEEIDAATGKEIAKNALRYLTWGVEYTPCVPAYKDYIKGFSTNKVYYDYYYLNYIFNNKYKVNFSFRPT